MSITDDRAAAEQALAQYDISADADMRLLNLSENATYLVTDGDARSILRGAPAELPSAARDRTELDWLAALRADSDVTVSLQPVARDGRRVGHRGRPGAAEHRHVVHFGMVGGVEPTTPR